MDLLLVLNNAGLSKVLQDALNPGATGPPGLLKEAPHLALYTVGPAPGPGVALADYTEATYDGYARLPLVFAPGGSAPDGRAQSMAPSVIFSPTGTVTANSIAGALLVNALTGGILLGVLKFPSPRSLSGPTDDLQIQIRFAVPSSAPEWGSGNTLP